MYFFKNALENESGRVPKQTCSQSAVRGVSNHDARRERSSVHMTDIFNFLIISLFFIENKCLYDAIRDLKREKKKSLAKGGIEPLVDRIKKTKTQDLPSALLLVLYVLIDRCLVQSAVSNLFPNQWRCLKIYLPLPVCLICHCVFWLVIMFSGLLLCLLNCYFVF